MGALAFLVFAVLWLSTQDWFDLVPRRVRRRAAAVGGVVLLIACLAVPTAFKTGFTRFIGYATEKVTARVEHVLRDTLTPETVPSSPSDSGGFPADAG